MSKSSYSSLTSYISMHKIKDNSCIRFHTAAGEEAQVDFDNIGLQYNLRDRKKEALFNIRYFGVIDSNSYEHRYIKKSINA